MYAIPTGGLDALLSGVGEASGLGTTDAVGVGATEG